MFDKILIANRGEIACRIIDTCRKQGVATVAVYSSADRNALHVAMADESVRIGAAPSTESYLNIGAVITAAKLSGAQAVHPGYGFLSENADFAEACSEAGLVFIGPPASAIRAMGSKAEAKRIMAAAGVPVLPGDTSVDQDDATLMASAEAAGYPVIVKPVAGGGGRGMRIVGIANELPDALASARREGASSFGDDTLLIEKYLESSRHIEVQIFGDSVGNIVHLFERDCSAQRRHQKVIEEAPAPALTEMVREKLFEASLLAGKAVGYIGAGTVEFLLGTDGDFWFMEMNTRLQVEHPVTEMITGIDLVEWQLRVASGEELPKLQDDITQSGHAIEARLYAEDPSNDFAPGFGALTHLHIPAEGGGLRIDSGVRQGDEVTIHYDPMIAKVIAHAPDRAAACAALSGVLGAVRVAGPATNEQFLKAIADHPVFREGAFDTGFIAKYLCNLAPSEPGNSAKIIALAALSELLRAPSATDDSPWSLSNNWRLGGSAQRRISIREGKDKISVVFEGGRLTCNGESVIVSGAWVDDIRFDAVIDGEPISAFVVSCGNDIVVFSDSMRSVVVIDDPLATSRGNAADAGTLFAQMPSVVVAVLVEDGAEVAAGTPLLAVEAMKVEHTIRAPADGVVTALHFSKGDRVAEGAELASFIPTELI